MNSYGLLTVGIALPAAFAWGVSFGDHRTGEEMQSRIETRTVYEPSPHFDVCEQILHLAWDYADPALFGALEDPKTFEPGD